MEAQLGSPDPNVIERLTYRAERLLMHARVLATLAPADRAAVEARRKDAPGTRVFSVGIGGIDLGMSSVFARAASRSTRLSLGAAGAAPAKAPAEQAQQRGRSGPRHHPARTLHHRRYCSSQSSTVLHHTRRLRGLSTQCPSSVK